MLITMSGRIASIGEGKYTTDNTPVIDFQLAVDRGNVKKRASLLTGKEYDADFYKVTLFGQTAISFAQYAQVGRNVDVSGRILQDEYLSKNQTVQIATDNPLYGYFRQLVGQVPQDQLSYDNAGNLYVKGNHAVNRVGMTGIECRWKDANPNANNGGGFQPQSNGFVNQGFGNANQGFNANANKGFNANANKGGGFGTQSGGFGTQPQSAGFGVQPQTQGFGVQPQQSPVMPQTFGGFQPQTVVQGFGSPQGNGFGVQPQGNNNPMNNFTGQENPQGNGNLPGFGGDSVQPQGFNANASGFIAPVNNGNVNQGFETAVDNTVNAGNVNTGNTAENVETNIPLVINNDGGEKKEETMNQGF